MEADEQIKQECQKLMSSVPKERGWVSCDLYKYQGYWHSSDYFQATIACQKHFKAQEDDVFLVTPPKSGTTWLKAIMFAIMNYKRYPINHSHPLRDSNPHDLVPFLEVNVYVDNPNPDFSSFTSPRLFATHLPLVSLPESVKDSSCKIVYLCRNPKDTFISLWHFANNLRPPGVEAKSIEEAFELFTRGVYLYGPFWEHVLGYWEQSLERPDKVLFLKFEDFKEQPTFQVKKLADFLGFPFLAELEGSGVLDQIVSLCRFDNLSNLEVNRKGKLFDGTENKTLFRRGEVGDWKNFLTPEMVDFFDRLTEQKFHAAGLQI